MLSISFMSRDHFSMIASASPSPKRPKAVVRCEECRKSFTPFHASSKRFCSQQCVKRWRADEADISGQHFHRLTALKRSKTGKHREPLWLSRCSCGSLTTVKKSSVVSG